MHTLLVNNPLLLLFIVAAVGYPLGRIKIRGSSLGVASVLFVGIAIGSLHPDLKLPEIIYVLGLVLFVYTVGLSSGPGFVASFRHEGIRDNLLVVAIIILATAMTFAIHYIFAIRTTLAVGMFTGSLTNTPALAGAMEAIKEYAPAGLREQLLSEPVIGYSLTYPMGVIGTLLALSLVQRLWHVDYEREAQSLRSLGATNDPIHNLSIKVSCPEAVGMTVEELRKRYNGEIIFGRIKHTDTVTIASDDTRLAIGDLVVAVGTLEDLDKVAQFLGERSAEQLELDRSEFYFRRVFVSNPDIAGCRLNDLNLEQRFGAVVTRLRRGDVDLVPHLGTVLELGDRVRIVAHRDRMKEVSAFFGDSYRAVSEIDILTFSLGLALGLLLGAAPIPLPGGISVKLGFAGGPLIAGLILGTIGRTGAMVWNIPYSANLTLRQIGLVLFLAGIGTRAGYSFASTFSSGNGLTLFTAGICITFGTVLTLLWVGHRIFRIPMSLLIGMTAGMQTQPAVLGYALEQTGNDLPTIGYTAVYPVATITKIVCVQVLLTLLPIN